MACIVGIVSTFQAMMMLCLLPSHHQTEGKGEKIQLESKYMLDAFPQQHRIVAAVLRRD